MTSDIINKKNSLGSTEIVIKIRMIILLCCLFSQTPAAESDFGDNTANFNMPVKSIAAFNVVVRDFDLNADTENGYTITSLEYEHLLKMWQWLPQSERTWLLQGDTDDAWNHTLTLPLLYSLNAGKSWELFITDMKRYGALGVAITLSRLNSPVSLETAHRTLVDLLQNGTNLFKNGKLRITETIKAIAEKRAGVKARMRLETWEKLINSNQEISDRDKLWLVNCFFNSTIQARADDTTTDSYDYWQSPLETLIRGIGDCEDFALAKYISLRLMGIPAERLLITMVYYPAYSQMHGVLAYYPIQKKDPYVLDNILFKYLGQKGSHIVPMSIRMKAHHLRPLWAINEDSFVEFHGGLKIKSVENDPCRKLPRFRIAMANSKRIIPERS